MIITYCLCFLCFEPFMSLIFKHWCVIELLLNHNNVMLMASWYRFTTLFFSHTDLQKLHLCLLSYKLTLWIKNDNSSLIKFRFNQKCYNSYESIWRLLKDYCFIVRKVINWYVLRKQMKVNWQYLKKKTCNEPLYKGFNHLLCLIFVLHYRYCFTSRL